jgi:predicted transporter
MTTVLFVLVKLLLVGAGTFSAVEFKTAEECTAALATLRVASNQPPEFAEVEVSCMPKAEFLKRIGERES